MMRPPLVAVYRVLRESDGAAGDELRGLLRGDGRYPRSAALCARLVRVLVELGLATYGDRRCTLVPGVRADLETAPTYKRCQQQLGQVRSYLAMAMPSVRRAA